MIAMALVGASVDALVGMTISGTFSRAATHLDVSMAFPPPMPTITSA